MSSKVKLSKEADRKAAEIIAFHGYSSLEEMVEDLIGKEYEKIKGAGDSKQELADKLSGLGYIS